MHGHPCMALKWKIITDRIHKKAQQRLLHLRRCNKFRLRLHLLLCFCSAVVENVPTASVSLDTEPTNLESLHWSSDLTHHAHVLELVLGRSDDKFHQFGCLLIKRSRIPGQTLQMFLPLAAVSVIHGLAVTKCRCEAEATASSLSVYGHSCSPALPPTGR